jgi:hypothetical protein
MIPLFLGELYLMVCIQSDLLSGCQAHLGGLLIYFACSMCLVLGTVQTLVIQTNKNEHVSLQCLWKTKFPTNVTHHNKVNTFYTLSIFFKFKNHVLL